MLLRRGGLAEGEADCGRLLGLRGRLAEAAGGVVVSLMVGTRFRGVDG